MKKSNTLRVQGDEYLIIVKDDAVIHLTSTGASMLWVSIFALALILAYMVRKFKKGLTFLSKVLVDLDAIDLKIASQAEVIKPMADGYFDQIEKNTRTINQKVQNNFSQLEAKWVQFLAEMKTLEAARTAQDQQVKVLSERLHNHLERIEPVEVNEAELRNPF